MAYTSEIEKLERRWAENPKGRNFAPLADAYRKAGELDRAIELCESGLERHPDYVSAHIVYGRCLIDMKNDAGAQGTFQKVLALDPENIIALKVLGEIAERNNRFDEAVDWLARLLNADPMNGDAAEALARAKSKVASAKPVAVADAATAPLTKPDFVVEHTDASEPVTPVAAAAKPSPDVETFDGTLDFNAAAHATAKAEGLEVQEDVELNSQQIEQVDVIGLARTQYEGSGMFKLDEPPSADAQPPIPELTDDAMPQVDLPLIMPDDMPAAQAPAPPPARRPAPPPPPPPPPPAAATVPAAVALSDDDGAADTATLSQAEPVLTETMAELYLKQGHQQDALRVYQALLAQRPSDARLRRRVEQLSGGGRTRRGSGVSAQAFLKGIWSGRAAVPQPQPPAPPPPPEPEPEPAPAAARPSAPAARQSTLEAAFDTAGGSGGGAVPGEPSHPAKDHISLDSVFGDDSRRRSAGAAGGGGSAPAEGGSASSGPSGPTGSSSTGGFSFDDFFGAAAPRAAPPDAAGGGGGGGVGGGGENAPAEPSGARTPGRSSGRAQRPPEDEVEADQFQQWLKKLKS